MNENEKNRYEALAATNPGRFLYEIVRSSPLGEIEVPLISLIQGSRYAKRRKMHIKRTWALDPAYDSIKVLFNKHATGDDRSLRQEAHRFVSNKARHRFSTPDNEILLDKNRITPAAVIEAITDAVKLARTLSKRPGAKDFVEAHDFKDENVLQKCDFCEQVFLPLLQKMPPDKSWAQYEAEAAKAARPAQAKPANN